MTTRRALLAAPLLAPALAGAQGAWPGRPVTVIVPWAAGRPPRRWWRARWRWARATPPPPCR